MSIVLRLKLQWARVQMCVCFRSWSYPHQQRFRCLCQLAVCLGTLGTRYSHCSNFHEGPFRGGTSRECSCHQVSMKTLHQSGMYSKNPPAEISTNITTQRCCLFSPDCTHIPRCGRESGMEPWRNNCLVLCVIQKLPPGTQSVNSGMHICIRH